MVRMVERVTQPRWTWGFVLGLGMLLALALWLGRQGYEMTLPVVMVGPLAQLARSNRPVLYVLTDDELIWVKEPGGAEHMPLAGATAEQTPKGCILRWPQSKVAQAQRLRVSVAFDHALQAAIAAKAGAPARSPAVVRVAPAGQPAWYWWAAGTAVVCLLAALWLRQPIGLLPMYTMLTLSLFQDRHYILTSTDVLVVARGGVTASIPVAAVTLQGRAMLTTRDTSYPTLRLPGSTTDTRRFLEQFNHLKAQQAITNR